MKSRRSTVIWREKLYRELVYYRGDTVLLVDDWLASDYPIQQSIDPGQSERRSPLKIGAFAASVLALATLYLERSHQNRLLQQSFLRLLHWMAFEPQQGGVHPLLQIPDSLVPSLDEHPVSSCLLSSVLDENNVPRNPSERASTGKYTTSLSSIVGSAG